MCNIKCLLHYINAVHKADLPEKGQLLPQLICVNLRDTYVSPALPWVTALMCRLHYRESQHLRVACTTVSHEPYESPALPWVTNLMCRLHYRESGHLCVACTTVSQDTYVSPALPWVRTLMCRLHYHESGHLRVACTTMSQDTYVSPALQWVRTLTCRLHYHESGHLCVATFSFLLLQASELSMQSGRSMLLLLLLLLAINIWCHVHRFGCFIASITNSHGVGHKIWPALSLQHYIASSKTASCYAYHNRRSLANCFSASALVSTVR
jgi:hypothetical protein